MAKIKISYTAPGADVVTAKIDNTPVSFSGTAKAGQAEVDLGAGNYRLRYTIEGLPGTSYTIKIEGSTPGKTINDTIGPTGIAAGSIPFMVLGGLAMAGAGVAVAATVAGAAVVVARRRSSKKKAAKKAAAKRSPAKRKAAKKAGAKKRSSSKKATGTRKTKRPSSKKGGRR